MGLESDFRGSQFSEDSTRGSTPAWAAPECFPSAPESFKEYKYKYLQDIYAFGLVVCFVLLRRLPINARDREKSKLVVQDLEHLIPEYPWLQNFLATLSNCLEYDPAQRKRFLAGIRESITYVSYFSSLTLTLTKETVTARTTDPLRVNGRLL